MSIREDAIKRVKTPIFEACAHNESLSLDQVFDGVAKGELVITKNKNHHFEKIIGIEFYFTVNLAEIGHIHF